MKYHFIFTIILFYTCCLNLSLSADIPKVVTHNTHYDGAYYNNHFQDPENGEHLIVNDTQDNISKQMEKDMLLLNKLSTNDIDQTMRLAKIGDIGYVDYKDAAHYNNFIDQEKEVPLKQLKRNVGKGRASSYDDDNNRIEYPHLQLHNSTVQTVFFPRGIMLLSGNTDTPENDNGVGNAFGLFEGSNTARKSKNSLPNAFIIVSVVAAVVGLAALNYFTLQHQLNNIDSTTSVCQAAKQLGDLNIPLATGMTGADLNRAIDAINNLPTVNCH